MNRCSTFLMHQVVCLSLTSGACMGGLFSSETQSIDTLGLQKYGVALLKSYQICCAYCCKEKPDTAEEPSSSGKKKVGCACCPWLYYCCQRCKYEDAENHLEAHKMSGELVIKIAPPSSKSKPSWSKPTFYQTMGVRLVNAGEGAIRISFPDKSVTVLVHNSKAKLISARPE